MSFLDKALDALDDFIKTGVEPADTNVVAEALQPGLDPTDSSLFDEEPVPLNVFVTDKLYLGAPKLSQEQFRLIALGEAIYFRETYDLLHWNHINEDWWYPHYTEIVAMWGKGSGKDYCCRIICARVAYLLLCLRDPQRYYNMGPDEAIHVLNVARSTAQANNVFFEPLKRMVVRSPWFSDKVDPKHGLLRFDKNIEAHSGHAEQESLEGQNLIIGVADEIASFKTKEELRSRGSARPGQHSADAISEMLRSSGQSRFPGLAKVIYISYPRFQGDFITQKYLQSLTEPTMYGTKKATWEVNPTKTKEMFTDEFRKDPEGSAGKYECNPPAATNKFFRNDKLIEAAFAKNVRQVVDDLGFILKEATFSHNKFCAVHLDLALTNDRAGIAMAHMQDWMVRTTVDGHELRQPIIFVDFVTSFAAHELGRSELSLEQLEDVVLLAKSKGAKIMLCTADQFQSEYMLQNIQKQGIECHRRSVDRDTSAYDLLKATIYGGRLVAAWRDRVVQELKSLRLVNGVKVDHPPGGSKDEADALCGAVAGATELAYRFLDLEVRGEYLGWAEPESAFHDGHRGQGPWSNRANFALNGYIPPRR